MRGRYFVAFVFCEKQWRLMPTYMEKTVCFEQEAKKKENRC